MNTIQELEARIIEQEAVIEAGAKLINELKEVAKDVAHIGVDFGFGKYQIAEDSQLIQKARDILTPQEPKA